MIEIAEQHDPPTPPPAHRRDWLDLALKALFAVLVGVAIWWLVWMWADVSSGSARGSGWVRNVVVPAWILGVACLVALRHERHWASPVQRLRRLLPEVRDGRAPIEALSQIGGGMGEVMPLVQDLLHEIRRQQLAVAELNDEIRQRVAVRTDALERKLGTLREQAARDPLTGLYNRRTLENILPRLLAKARLGRTDVAVLMIDIDQFKPLNDTLGHAAGDALLRDVARLIQSSLGEADLAIRYGGDEFLVVLPGATVEQASMLARRLTSLVDALAKPLRVARAPRLSVGTAQLSELRGASAEDLVATADRNLYHAKAIQRAGPPASPAEPLTTPA